MSHPREKTLRRCGHLTHGYATTIHKSQGLTCDEAFVYADETIYREAGYTALSRARCETRLYVATSDLSLDKTSLLTRSRAQHLATSQQDRGGPHESTNRSAGLSR